MGGEGKVHYRRPHQRLNNVLALCASESVRIRVLTEHIVDVLPFCCGKREVLENVTSS